MALRAVDISHGKAITDWNALCAYADILIFKASEGPDFTDPLFASRLAEARRRGKLIGYYHYVGWSQLTGRPARVFDPVVEADWFARHFTHQPGEVPIADWEPRNPPGDPDGWLATFLLRLVTAHGCPVGMTYMNTTAAASSLWTRARAVGTALWIARYYANNGQVPTTQPSPGSFGSYAMWQYTSNGAVPGVSGPVDVSLFYGTPAQWRAIGGAGKPTPPTPPTVQEDDMRLVRSNDTGGVWLLGEFSMEAVPDQATYQAWQAAGIPAVGLPQSTIDALAVQTDTRRKGLLNDMQGWILGHQPTEAEQPYLWDRVKALDPAALVDAITKALPTVKPDDVATLVADAIIKKIPGTTLSRDDVKGAVQDVFAAASQTATA